MRRHLLSLLLLAAPLYAASQQRIAGIRQGLGFWLTTSGVGKGSLRYADGQHFTWDKELFLRGNLSRKWQLEGSVLTYGFTNDRTKPQPSDTLTFREKNRIIEGRLSLQYDVTYPLFAIMFGQLSGMRSFVGVEICPRASLDEIVYEGGSPAQRAVNYSLLTQFSYTHVVPIHRRWAITTVLSFGGIPFDKWTSRREGYPSNRRIALRTGIGYRF